MLKALCWSYRWCLLIIFSLSSTRASNELGAGNPQAASLAVRVVLLLAIAEGIIVVSLMISLRKVWGHLYSNETEVITHVAAMMPILAASSFLDGIQSVLSGIRTINFLHSSFTNLHLCGNPKHNKNFYAKRRFLSWEVRAFQYFTTTIFGYSINVR